MLHIPLNSENIAVNSTKHHELLFGEEGGRYPHNLINQLDATVFSAALKP